LAAATPGPLQNFYEACLARGVKASMARLTLARKIASITLVVWKKGVGFDAKHLKHTQLERLVRSGSFAVLISGDDFGSSNALVEGEHP